MPNFICLVNNYESLWLEPLYKYAAVIDFNYGANKILGKGSGIFFHIAPPGGGGTAGCIAVTEDHLVKILKWMDPSKNPCIMLGAQRIWDIAKAMSLNITL